MLRKKQIREKGRKIKKMMGIKYRKKELYLYMEEIVLAPQKDILGLENKGTQKTG